MADAIPVAGTGKVAIKVADPVVKENPTVEAQVEKDPRGVRIEPASPSAKPFYRLDY
jgi:hypothetical protein